MNTSRIRVLTLYKQWLRVAQGFGKRHPGMEKKFLVNLRSYFVFSSMDGFLSTHDQFELFEESEALLKTYQKMIAAPEGCLEMFNKTRLLGLASQGNVVNDDGT